MYVTSLHCFYCLRELKEISSKRNISLKYFRNSTINLRREEKCCSVYGMRPILWSEKPPLRPDIFRTDSR